jgi:hypothetical protein
MKILGVLLGGIATIYGGLQLLPSVTIFIGITLGASILCYLLCNNMDPDYAAVERVLIALLGNVVGSFILVWVIPAGFGSELGFQYVLLAGVAAAIGTFIGAISAEYYMPKRM